MIDTIDAALVAQNDGGAMAVINELALAMTAGSGGATLDSALRAVAADRGGEAALGQLLRDALHSGASRGALAVLDLLIDRLDIDPAAGASACGCKGKGGSRDPVDSGGGGAELAPMSLSTTSTGGNYDDANGNGEYDEGETIYVGGTRPRDPDEEDDGGGTGDPWWNPNPGGGTETDPGGSGPGEGGDSGEPVDEAKDTPCVDEKPEGVGLNELNDLAKVAAAKLGTLQESTGWEWGAFIYRGADGRLYITEAFTAKDPDSLDGAIATVPAGGHIVGYVHTHPIDPYSDQRNLSDEDRQFIDRLMNRTGSTTVDPNMLAYVTTKDSSAAEYYDDYVTYVYDKSERDSTNPGCDL